MQSLHLDFKGKFWVKAAIYTNNYSLFHYLGNYTIFNSPYSSQYRLLENGRYFKPYYTLNGQTFFFAPLEKGSKVIISNIIYDLYYIYLGIVALLVVILIIPTLIKYRIKKSWLCHCLISVVAVDVLNILIEAYMVSYFTVHL